MSNLNDKRYWKKLTQTFTNWMEKDRYDYNRTILVEQTGFFPMHVGDRGPNHNESGLLEFTTRIIEAKAIHFAGGANEYFTRVFVQATVYNHDEAGTYLELRAKGKTYSIVMHDHSREIPHQLIQAIGPIHEFYKEEYQTFVERKLDNVVDIQSGQRTDQMNSDDLEREFEKEKASDIVDMFQEYSQHEFKQRLEAAGIKIITFFKFTHALGGVGIPHHGYGYGFNPSYVKENSKGIEMGTYSSGTYNALPFVVKITRVRKMPTVKLNTLGIEKKGYYDHHYNCSIPANQVAKAKAFFGKRFKRRKVG